MPKTSNQAGCDLLEGPIDLHDTEPHHPEHGQHSSLGLTTPERASHPPSGPAETYAMPATQGQTRFWSLDRLNPGNPALNMPLMWQCTGPLDVLALTEAFARCVQRHESLRTTFDMVRGKLSQIIHPDSNIPIPLADLTGLSGEPQRVEADRLTREHATFRFDLKHGPLLILELLKLGPQNHLLLVNMHHIICDGISNGVLMRDMLAWYEALVHDSVPELPELAIQFADYAVWHQDWLNSSERDVSVEFWHNTLGHDFTPIKLQHDADARSTLASDRLTLTGDIETQLIPADLTARAHAFCIRENVTLNMLLFSIFCGLLSRITGQKDLTIGSPCANRTEDTQDLIGMFMNIQILRVKLEDASTFRDLLRQIETWTLGAYENQALPFEELIHDPFFSEGGSSFEVPIFFLYQKSFMITGTVSTPSGDLRIVPLRSESPGAIFEIMFAIVDRLNEGPRLQLEYNPQHFKSTTIQRYLRLFLNLLESALNAPDKRVELLSLVSNSERNRLIVEPNRTAFDFGPFESIPATFLRRAAAHPDGLAAEFGEERWTNAQLAAYASALAFRLMGEGIKPGDLVGICVARSLRMLGALLGVMMSGAAYVPLDPLHPRERLETILSDCDPAILITDAPLAFKTSARILNLAQDRSTPNSSHPDPSRPDSSAPLPAVLPESVVYVIYTSGSTGTPKGVVLEHAALFNLMRALQQQPGITETDTLVAVTTISFDIAAVELLLPLLTGARLVIASEQQAHDPKLLLALLRESRATVLQATPGTWQALLDAGWTSELPLRALCGGEALSRFLADRILDRTPDLWNLYGPTEAAIWSSLTRVIRGADAPRLGKPIANTQLYVLDKHQQITPAGVDGELYIGGAGVARGYWNRPDLTEARFLPNPFGPGKMYCTGDRVRRQDDGSLEFLGRTDFQVKMRGYRVELGEIEATLRQHPHVRDAVVMMHSGTLEGSERLVAFVDAGSHAASTVLPAELAQLVAQVLPDYMQPAPIHPLSDLPRNTSGKIDRKALAALLAKLEQPQPSITTEELDQSQAADVIERQITEIWQSTLGIARISKHDSFFSLGVGSLAALRLITKMNRVYDMDLGVASLLSASTIDSISELVRSRFTPNTASSLVPIQPVGSKPPLFIVHGVGGNVVNFYGLSMRMGADQPVYGIQSQALVAGESALIRLEDMAALYLRDIRVVQPHGPYKFLGYSFGGTVVLEIAHQLQAAGEEVALLGMLDSRTIQYEQEHARTRSLQGKVGHRVNRFSGNISSLDLKSQVAYIWDKVVTRSIRYACMAAATLKLSRVPAFMKSAYDINYVALQNYRLRPYKGSLILFRALEQDYEQGAYDLGWSSIFRGGVDVRDLPGDHARIFLEPNIEELAASLRACLKDS